MSRRTLLVGYARVSPLDQDTAAQVGWLRNRGVAAENIWTDRGFAGRPIRPVGRDGAIKEARRATLLVPAWGGSAVPPATSPTSWSGWPTTAPD